MRDTAAKLQEWTLEYKPIVSVKVDGGVTSV